MNDALAMTLEAEVARLDDARVDGADGDLVHLFSFDFEVVHDARNDRLGFRPAPRIVPGPVGGVEPDRLEPGMSFGKNAPLLRDLALEEMGLREVRRECRIGFLHERGSDGERRVAVKQDDGQQPYLTSVRHPEEGDESSIAAAGDQRLVEELHFENWNLLQRRASAVGKDSCRVYHHQPVPSAAAARWSAASSGGGR